MWRLSVRPSAESRLDPVDVVVTADAGGRVADLAAGLGTHLGGPTGGLLLAPTSGGRPWPAQTPLTETALRDGDVLEVASVPPEWLDRPAQRTPPRAVVHVVAGPDAGTQVPVTGDAATIGRAGTCTVRLTDPLVSRHHARILLTGTPVVQDDGSAHGTRVAGRAITRPQPVEWGEQVVLGDTVLVVRPGTADGGAHRGVFRSPRFGESVAATEHEVPAAPAEMRRTPIPWPMMIMPLVMGGAMYATLRNAFSLVFMLGFPLMMGLNHLMQRRQARKEYEEKAALWRADLAGVLGLLDDAARVQRVTADDDEPDLDVVLARATSRDHRLWVRQVDDDDFLTVRAGRGPRPALVTAKITGQGDRVLRAEATEAISARATLADLPVPLALADAPLTAVVGPGGDVDAWVRAAVVRLAVTHSPNDVRVAAVLGTERAHVESWLRWLPHATPLAGGAACVTVGAADGQVLLDDLASTDGGTTHTVCLVDAGAGVPRRLVEAVAAAAADPERRLHLVWLGERLTEVPAATDVALDLHTASLLRADRGGVEELTSVDSLDLTTAWRAARALSGYRDEAAVAAAESLLPQQVRLPDLAADLADPDDVARLLDRWAASTGLRAQLGAGADGVVSIDLREDGPHGLVAGTTGAGKSELLQSLILSLAMNNPPSRITFLLVDYKGGAAFRECADLPHSVGYITDLTPALVQRALTSLHAELTAREHLLAQYGAKDLVALERSHPEAAPPSMLICVDEFAALLAEVPEFVDGMVSIAQRGRSLGMHMLLATQRPAGVVTPQIKANTDLRIALRVASPDDSTDVIDAPDAANLSRRTPGRAWLRRTGHGTRELVQVAYVGAREQIREAGSAVQVAPFTALALPGPTAGRTARVHPTTDLERMVATAGTAFLRTGRPAPKKPWLPPLPTELPMAVATPGELLLGAGARDEALVAGGAGAGVVRAAQRPGQVVLGLIDRPAEQSQEPWVVDYARSGHLLVFGASGSGKTELLRTLAAAVTAGTHGTDPAPDCLYGIDAGGGGLTVLERLGSVGSIVVEQQPERMLRLVRMLHRTVTERNAALAARGVADVDALAATGVDLQRIHLVIDNLPAVMDAFEGGGAIRRQHGEQLVTILQEGRRCGVHVTATAPQRTGVPSQLQAAFGQRLVLRMTVADDYAMLGVPGNVLDGDTPAGRGLVGKHEVQVATVGGAGTPLQAERLDELSAVVAGRFDAPPAPVPAMPSRLPAHLLPAPRADEVCVGVEEGFVSAVTLPLRAAPLLIAGRARSGRTSALLGLAQLARRSGQPPARITLAGPRTASPLAVGAGTLDPAAVADEVLTSPEALLAWVEAHDGGTSAGAHGTGAGGTQGGGDTTEHGWSLLLLDDLHEWERAWEANGAERRALEALVAHLGRTAADGLAVVGATDPDDARSRQHVPGVVAALRRSRRAVLLAPEMGDGSLVAAQVPMNSHEPLSGVGRGLLVSGGSAHVIQLLSAAEEGA